MALSKTALASISQNFIIPAAQQNIWGYGPLFITEWVSKLNTSIKKEWGDKAGINGSDLYVCGAVMGSCKDQGIEMYLLLPGGKPLLMHKDSETLNDDVNIAISYYIGKTAKDMMLDEAWAEYKRKSRKVSSELFVTRKDSDSSQFWK